MSGATASGILRGAGPNGVPVAPVFVADHAAWRAGVPLRQAMSDPDLLAKVLLDAWRFYETDLIVVFSDVTVEAEALGAGVAWPDGEPPRVERFPGTDVLRTLDPKRDGRLPVILGAARRIVAEVGDQIPVLVSLKGPFSLSALLGGVENLLTDAVEHPERAEKVLRAATDCQEAYLREIALTGCMPLIGEPFASGSVLGPAHFERLALPGLVRLVDASHELDMPVGIHICGDLDPVLDHTLKAGADLLHVEKADLEKIAATGATILTGVPTDILQTGPEEEVRAAVRRAVESIPEDSRFILGTECDVPTSAPEKLVTALVEEARAALRAEHEVTIREGESLLTALYRDGHFVRADCGGNQRCRGCRVELVPDGGVRRACDQCGPGTYTVRPRDPVIIPSGRLPATPSSGTELHLAVDLGSTTVAAGIFDRNSDDADWTSRHNPQVAYGEDVLSRADFAREPDHRARLADLARRTVRDLLADLLRRHRVSVEDIRTAVLAGNATMTTLFLERDPTSLLSVPFEPGLANEGYIRVEPAWLGLAATIDVHFLPAIGGHVGSDTTAAVLASALLEGVQPALLLDLGTNGEVVLSVPGRVMAASSAAGPAFEGGGITHGSPARSGAIAAVRLSNGTVECSHLGPARTPVSWCGSGVLDIVSILREAGDIDPSGRLVREPDLPVPFTQADVRAVQLAKGAVAAAVKTLCREAGIRPQDIRRTVLTGAFGHALDASSAERIGLIPGDVPAETQGNGALIGASIADTALELAHAETVARIIEHIPLGDREDFQETFVDCMALEEMR